jgi:hypothetical protein
MKARRESFLLVLATFSQLVAILGVHAFSTTTQRRPPQSKPDPSSSFLSLSLSSSSSSSNNNNNNALASSWKSFYEASELRYVQLDNETKLRIQQLQDELESSRSQMVLAQQQALLELQQQEKQQAAAAVKVAEEAQQRTVTTSQHAAAKEEEAAAKFEQCRQQFLLDIRDLQEERDRLELRWAEECERSKQVVANLRRQQVVELQQVQEMAASDLRATVADYSAQLARVEERLRHAHLKVSEQERLLTQNSDYIKVLEQERRNLRTLITLSIRLCQQRLVNGLNWLIHPFRSGRRHPPNGTSTRLPRRIKTFTGPWPSNEVVATVDSHEKIYDILLPKKNAPIIPCQQRKKETHGLSSYIEKLPASEAFTSPNIYPRGLGSVSVRQGKRKLMYDQGVYREVYRSRCCGGKGRLPTSEKSGHACLRSLEGGILAV